MAYRLEYIGVKVGLSFREYLLRVTQVDEEIQDFTMAIPQEAFLSSRVRYQDAPQLCYAKLQRELAACDGRLEGRRSCVTDEDLDEYRVAHTPKEVRPTRRHVDLPEQPRS